MSWTCPVTSNRKGRVLPKVFTYNDWMPNRYFDTRLCRKKLGRWILRFTNDVCPLFGQKTDESSDAYDIYVFQYVLCDNVHGGVSDTGSEWSGFQVLQQL